MSSKKFKFGFIANSAEIANMFSNCIDPHNEEVSIRYSSMEDAIPVAKDFLKEGMEVVLSSDGTGSLLIQTLGYPIVNITRTHLDILNALLKAKDFGPFIAITMFGAPLDGITLFDELLSIKVRQVVFSTKEQLIRGISDAMREGIDCLVGAGISQHIVEAMGGKFVRVPLRKDMIVQALREARAIATARGNEKENEEELRTILQIIKEGLVVVDNEGVVKICNQMAADILRTGLEETMNRPLPEFLREAGMLNVLNTGEAEIDQIRQLRDDYIVVNSLPIRIEDKTHGVVSTFQEATRIHNIDLKLKEKVYLSGFVAKYTEDHIKGKSLEVKKMVEKARKYAQTDLAILIQGETGTGKEVLGQTIHNLSRRKAWPFVAINCSALTETLLESELFGYEEGAFTGAKKGGKMGLFELGQHGTIFLDEIADISPGIQVKLLRVLEEKKVRRVGGDRLIPVDVRIISSTLKDLLKEIESGLFRMDLYFRLASHRLRLPPLRERPEDIPEILRSLPHKYGKGKEAISPPMLDLMRDYHWPGNIREMISLVETYLTLLSGPKPDEQLFFDLFGEFCQTRPRTTGEPDPAGPTPAGPTPAGPDHGFDLPVRPLRDQLEEHEKFIIHETFKKLRYNRRETAKMLGIGMTTLWRKLNS
ncbi:MAG: sigma 54-interacting transcriptional regulator [Syntrophobacteraceae bacterium]